MADPERDSTTPARSAKPKAERRAESNAAGDIDLEALGRDKLLQLEKDVEKALRSYEKRKRDEALREMQLVAEKHGIALRDVIQGGSKQSVQVPKYRHPENPALTWSGRGRQPAWFREAIDAGHSRENLLVA